MLFETNLTAQVGIADCRVDSHDFVLPAEFSLCCDEAIEGQSENAPDN
jgi:hypothetical protein